MARDFCYLKKHPKFWGIFGLAWKITFKRKIAFKRKKKPPIFFGGVFCLTSELAQVLADVVDDLERRPFRRINLIICAVVKLFAFGEEAFNRLKALIAAAV